jgi:hypothetical protein
MINLDAAANINQSSGSIEFDFNEKNGHDLTEIESARLERAIEGDGDIETIDKASMSRQHSHFVELNSNNEDMLLEEIDDDDRQSINNMLALDADDKIEGNGIAMADNDE